ncbi:MAG TPA: ABC transporter substrate-binding protein [Rhodopila sp.]|jgi:ABC-type branched-subunit amino acid transport system substrate-binding protein
MPSRRDFVGMATATGALSLVLPPGAAAEQSGSDRKKAPGITDSEIKIGQTMPYSGPISAYGEIGRAQAAYFRMINDQGGINGRKINLVSLDDGYSPPKTVEQIRRLVEQDQVAFIFQSLGDVTNAAVQRYLNERHIPQLFLADGSSVWDDPKHFPWTMSWQPSYRTAAHIDAKYILENKPDAKIAVLVQDSLGGRDYMGGLREVLGSKADTMIVKELTYQVTDSTIDSQISVLQASGADTFFDIAVPKFAAQAIRKIYDIDWKPLHMLAYVSSSVNVTLKPAGLDKSVGVMSTSFLKFPDDPQWQDDPAMKEFMAWADKYYPGGDKGDADIVYAYVTAQTLIQVLKQCADDMSRENVMRQAANLHDVELPLLLPGIRVNTSPTDYRPVKQMRPMRFNGHHWELMGELITG